MKNTIIFLPLVANPRFLLLLQIKSISLSIKTQGLRIALGMSRGAKIFFKLVSSPPIREILHIIKIYEYYLTYPITKCYVLRYLK